MTAATTDLSDRIMAALLAERADMNKREGEGAFKVTHGAALIRKMLAEAYPAKKTRRPKTSTMTDEQFVAFLKAEPAYKDVNVDAEIEFARAWIAARKERKFTRAFLEKWIAKEARDAKMRAPIPVTSASSSAPWRAEAPNWRWLLEEFPVRDKKDPRYCDDWAKLSDEGKRLAWGLHNKKSS